MFLPNLLNFFVNIFRNANVSMDPFWAAVLLQGIRFLISVISLPINGKFKKKIVYLTCCVITCIGTLILATYSYINIDEKLTLNHPWTGFVPLFGIVIMYLAYGVGLGTIPFMLQVNMKNFNYSNLRGAN